MTHAPTPAIDSLELFAGKKAYTTAALDAGRVAVGIDIADAKTRLQKETGREGWLARWVAA
jgi:hypothetical protein